jgi:UPF0042 nucleotide-binding protein
MMITLMSFSFKCGLPPEADMVFDARFLKNPHYEPSLSALTGLDAAAGAYIETDANFAGFFSHIADFIEWLLLRYTNKDLTVAIGCTGGRHRSVYLVQKLGSFLRGKSYNVTMKHRDLE